MTEAVGAFLRRKIDDRRSGKRTRNPRPTQAAAGEGQVARANRRRAPGAQPRARDRAR